MQDIVNENEALLDHKEGFDLVLEVFEKTIKQHPEPILEIGTNMGGSSKCFLEILNNNKKLNYLIGVDPFGSVPYHNGAFQQESSVYENQRYYSSMSMLYELAKTLNLNYTHFKMSSEDFMNVYPFLSLYPGSVSQKLNKFSFVYLDGSHDPEIVKKEVEFFLDKFTGTIIVDDWEGDRFPNFIDYLLKINQSLTFDTSIVHRLVIKHHVENTIS